jgi:hypothetical protein
LERLSIRRHHCAQSKGAADYGRLKQLIRIILCGLERGDGGGGDRGAPDGPDLYFLREVFRQGNAGGIRQGVVSSSC